MILATPKNFSALVKLLAVADTYALDTETTGLRPYHGNQLFCLVIASRGAEYYFNFQDYPQENIVGLSRGLLPELAPIFQNAASRWRIHNAKFDLAMLAREGLYIAGEVHCTEAVGRIVNNSLMSYSLENLGRKIGVEKDKAVERYIDEHKLYAKEVDEESGKETKQLHYWRVPFSLIAPYAAQDTRVCYALGEHQEEALAKLDSEQRPARAVFSNEKKLTPVLFRMEHLGVLIDKDYTRRALNYELKRLEAARTDFEAFASRATGREVEYVDSAKCFAPIFDAVGERYPLTEKGNPSFKREALEGMSTPLASKILAYREAKKISGTYYTNFLYFADEHGAIHGNARQGGTKTGRLSYSEPNMQNLNKESLHHCGACGEDMEKPDRPCAACGATDAKEREYMVRRAFVPRPGFFFLSPDYDQMEYRLMLDYAGESEVIRQVLSGTDVHQATANLMEVSRRDAKTINFMLLYGGGIAKLCQSLFRPTLPLETLKALGRKHIYKMRSYEGKELHDMLLAPLKPGEIDLNLVELVKAHTLLERYFSALPKVKRFIKDVQTVANDRHYIVNWLGRRSYFGPGVPTHKAPNYLIQGGCADIVKSAMVTLQERVLAGAHSRMLLQIHDELLFEIRYGEEHLIPRIKATMEGAYRGKHLPLTCGVDYSERSWADKRAWHA